MFVHLHTDRAALTSINAAHRFVPALHLLSILMMSVIIQSEAAAWIDNLMQNTKWKNGLEHFAIILFCNLLKSYTDFFFNLSHGNVFFFFFFFCFDGKDGLSSLAECPVCSGGWRDPGVDDFSLLAMWGCWICGIKWSCDFAARSRLQTTPMWPNLSSRGQCRWCYSISYIKIGQYLLIERRAKIGHEGFYCSKTMFSVISCLHQAILVVVLS